MTVLCQKGLIDIFGYFVLFMDYDTTAIIVIIHLT